MSEEKELALVNRWLGLNLEEADIDDIDFWPETVDIEPKCYKKETIGKFIDTDCPFEIDYNEGCNIHFSYSIPKQYAEEAEAYYLALCKEKAGWSRPDLMIYGTPPTRLSLGEVKLVSTSPMPEWGMGTKETPSE